MSALPARIALSWSNSSSPASVPPLLSCALAATEVLTCLLLPRIFEDEIQSVVDARTETLQSLRELGPPDLVHLVKQPKGTTNKVRRDMASLASKTLGRADTL